MTTTKISMMMTRISTMIRCRIRTMRISLLMWGGVRLRRVGRRSIRRIVSSSERRTRERAAAAGLGGYRSSTLLYSTPLSSSEEVAPNWIERNRNRNRINIKSSKSVSYSLLFSLLLLKLFRFFLVKPDFSPFTLLPSPSPIPPLPVHPFIFLPPFLRSGLDSLHTTYIHCSPFQYLAAQY